MSSYSLVKPAEERVPNELPPKMETETKADACFGEFQKQLSALDDPPPGVAAFNCQPWDKADSVLKKGKTYHQCLMDSVDMTWDEKKCLKLWADCQMHKLP